MTQPGIKMRVQMTLQATQSALTMGQIIDAAGIPKTSASEVSAALYKLRGAGQIKAMRGPSTSLKGPRFVRMYQWITRAAPKAPKEPAAHVHHLTGIFRL